MTTTNSSFAILEVQRRRLEYAQQITERMTNFRRPFNAALVEFYRHYVGRAEAKLYPDNKTPRSSTFVPYPYANVNFVRDAIMNDLFSFTPPFEVLPRGVRDGESALRMQKVLELKVLQEAQLASKFGDFLGGLCIYGFGALKVEWDWDYDIVMDEQVQPATGPDGQMIVNPLTGEPHLQRIPVPVSVPRARPVYVPLDIFDILIDPDGAFVALLFDKTFPQMLREQQMHAQMHNRPLYDEDALGRLDEHVRRLGDQAPHALIHLVELWDVHEGVFTTFTAKEDTELLAWKDQRLAYRARGSYRTWRRTTAEAPPLLLAHDANPYVHKRVPVLWTSYNRVPGEIIGTGVIEPSWEAVEAVNRFVDLITDNWVMGVNQRLIVNGDRDIDFQELQENNTPGGLIVGYGPPNQFVAPLPVHTPSAGDYSILQLFRSLIEVSANVSDPYQRGVGAPTGNRTATGIQSVIQQSNQGRAALVRRLCTDILEPLLAMSASMIQQYITDDLEVRITDEKPAIPKVQSQFLKIQPSELKGAFDFRFIGAAYMEPAFVRQRNILALANILQGSPYLKQHAAQWELLRIFNIPYPQRFLYTEEEVAQMQAQAAQAQLQQALLQQRLGLAPGQSNAQAPGQAEPRRRVQFEGNAPITGNVRTEAQNLGANALGLGGMSEDMGAM